MLRIARVTPGGQVYHVLNRSVGKLHLFRRDPDFDAFVRVMLEAHQRHPVRILSYCLLSTHWHFVVWPKGDSDVTDFFRWLAHTHAMRWRVAHHTVGYGHLYQGRFKSFPVQTDDHLLTVCRYVERNALSAGMVERAERWRYSSLWARANGDEKLKAILSDWPVDQPRDWVEHVNHALSTKEKELFLMSLKRNRPFGSDSWTQRLVDRLGLEHTIRAEGRPRKQRSVDK